MTNADCDPCDPCAFCGFDGPADADCPPECRSHGWDPFDAVTGKRDAAPVPSEPTGPAHPREIVKYAYRGVHPSTGRHTVKTLVRALGKRYCVPHEAQHFATAGEAARYIDGIMAEWPNAIRVSY